MFVLITYDVNVTSADGAKRLRSVARACTDHGTRVQASVFECVLTEAQYVVLKRRLESMIDARHDSIRFYLLGNNWQRRIETLGKDFGINFTGELIV